VKSGIFIGQRLVEAVFVELQMHEATPKELLILMFSTLRPHTAVWLVEPRCDAAVLLGVD